MCKCYRWLRHPRTTQERERNLRREERQFVRGKRTNHRLPNAWDNIAIPTRKNECWKKLRNTQYKPR